MRDPHLAQIVADRLHPFDGQRYDLWSDVTLPNHVHALFTLRDGESLPDTLQGWKGISSRLSHPTGLSALNPFWQPDDSDRLIRSPEHFSAVKAYIRENPAKARQAKQPEEVSRQTAKFSLPVVPAKPRKIST